MAHDPDQDRTAPSTRRSRWIPALWIVSALALLALIVEIAVLWPQAKRVDQEAKDRAQATAVAQQFVVQYNSYNFKELEGYDTELAKLLSTKLRAEFTRTYSDLKQLMVAGEMVSTDAKILKSSVASIDRDSALVLVAADAKINTAFDNRIRHFRWEIEMVKAKGKWFVDNFDPVVDPNGIDTGETVPDPSAPTPSAPAPSTSPTPQPSPTQGADQ